MNDYLQPDFYHFNEDSLKLVNWIFSCSPTASSLLDLGAGSGVVGIELANRLNLTDLTFLEVQADFLPSLQRNVQNQLKQPGHVQLIHSSFGEWIPVRFYDLIVCNPPYYLPGHGVANKDLRRRIARSFVIDDWSVLVNKIGHTLSKRGKAYMVIKNDPKILRSLQSVVGQLRLEVQEEADLFFIELSRLNVD